MAVMKMVMGLGNPGRKYKNTPHNLGFEVIDLLAARWKWELKKSLRYKSIWIKNKFALEKTLLIKPLAYVNLTGQVVEKFSKYYNFKSSDFVLICDDANLKLGDIRIRRKGGAGGHKGVESVIAALGSKDFMRVRLGIATEEMKGMNLERYVLSKWSEKELKVCREIINKTGDAVETILRDGIEKAMNVYN
jgi:PTH1 family peptidyl-tRNA hydrolase